MAVHRHTQFTFVTLACVCRPCMCIVALRLLAHVFELPRGSRDAALPYAAQPCLAPLPCLFLSCSALCLALSCPFAALLYLGVPCLALPFLVLPRPFALPCLVFPCSAILCPALSCHTPLRSALPCPAFTLLCSALPWHALPYPALRCPALPSAALPCSALPCLCFAPT